MVSDWGFKRVLSAFAALVTAAVLSVSLGISALPAASSPITMNLETVMQRTGGPGHGVWFCQAYPFLRPLCRGRGR